MLWVKGSGGDLGSMKRDGFATLYLDKLEGLKGLYRGLAHEDEMVALFNHCTFNLNPRATSIDTPLHAFVPHAHVDHVHADAVIAIAASPDAEELTREDVRRRARLPALAAAGLRPRPQARRDGGEQSRLCRRGARRPRAVHLGARPSKACYETTLRVIDQAADWLAANEKRPAFGGARVEPRSNRRDGARSPRG